jgi:beta-galactosidase
MMIKYVLHLIICLLVFQESFSQAIQPGLNLLDFDWLFNRGGALGAESPKFDDSAWRQIDLPHDWSIENLPGMDTPFNPTAINQVNGGFTEGGTGWYRRVFTVPVNQNDRVFHLQFDGVYMNAEVWLNGKCLVIVKSGRHEGEIQLTIHSEDIQSSLIRIGVEN